jgi:hypothetical protein
MNIENIYENYIQQNFNLNNFLTFLYEKKYEPISFIEIDKDKLINYFNEKIINSENIDEDLIFSYIYFLFIYSEIQNLYELFKNKKNKFSNYFRIFFYLHEKIFDLYISEIENLKVISSNISMIHILYFEINNLKIDNEIKYLLNVNFDLISNEKIIIFFINYLLKENKYGTLYYLINKSKYINELKEKLDLFFYIAELSSDINLKKENINNYINFIALYKDKINLEIYNKLEQNFNNLKKIENLKLEFYFLFDEKNFPKFINLFPVINFKLIKYKLNNIEIDLNKNELLLNLKKILLLLIKNDPGFSLYYGFLAYIYSLLNLKNNLYKIYENILKIFEISKLENETLNYLIKSFFIIKDKKTTLELINNYKGEKPPFINKILSIIK